MNPTPERALELAYTQDELANNSLIVSDVSKQKYHEEVAAILRAYADLSQKWQAVLDAEVVAEVRPSVTFPGNHMLNYKFAVVNDLAVGTQLIIKPAP